MKYFIFLVPLFISACGSTTGSAPSFDTSETGQAVGDMLSGLNDQASGVTGFTAMNDGFRESKENAFDLFRNFHFFHEAEAAYCFTRTFSSCSSGARSRTFESCTNFRGFTLSGKVDLSFSDTSGCALSTAGDTLTRLPNYTLTGRKGATLAVSSSAVSDYTGKTYGGGQRLTLVSTGVYTWDTLGVNRILSKGDGKTLFNISTRTTGGFSITGATRSTRTISGGVLEINHNLAKYTASWSVTQALTHSSDSSCICPVAGVLTGTFTGTIEGTGTLTFTSTCGEVTFAPPNQPTTTLQLENCGGNS